MQARIVFCFKTYREGLPAAAPGRATPSPMSLKKLGRYELIRVLGKGAMGLVYEGRDPNLDRRVAIKTIKVENLSEEAAAEYEVRFRTEARSAARLQHPHIVSVYDSDRDGDIAFLVMEFIQGDDLKHHLDRGDLYTLEQTLRIVGELLSALDYAHRQNIVHRDIKPANLLMADGGRVKLTDFGVARIQDSGDATRTQGSMVGTLKYMSPEQVQGRPIDARADLFAAGIVLYQLLTGRRPFDGDTDFAIIQQIVGHSPAPPSTHNPQLPPAMDAVVARALAKSRDQRFASAQEFSAALQAATREAFDPTLLPPAAVPGPGGSSTWTSTLLAGEALVGMQTDVGTSPSTVTQEVELVYWKDVKESTDVEDLQGFLDKFPAGIYAGLARRRLKKLVEPGEDSNIGARISTGTLVMPRAVPADPAASGAVAPGTADSAWKALQDAAAAPATAAPAASLAHDPDATRLGAPPAAQPLPSALATPAAASTPLLPLSPSSPPAPAAPPVAAASALASAPPLPEAAPPAEGAVRPGKTGAGGKPAAPPARASTRPRRWVWAVTGVLALTAMVAGMKFLARPAAPSGPAAAAAVAAPGGTSPAAAIAPPVAAPEAATTAVSTPAQLAAPPAATGASAPGAADPAAARLAAAATAKKAAQEKERLAKQAQAKSALAATAAAAAVNQPGPAVQPERHPAAAPVSAGNPRQACEDRMLIGFQVCMAEQCAKPAFANHPVCAERRAMEQRRRDAERLSR